MDLVTERLLRKIAPQFSHIGGKISWGPHLMILRAYILLVLSSGSLLAGSEDYMGYQGLNLGRFDLDKHPTLYYLSGPEFYF